jgi:F-type H+-transporting ATPase subunit delta
VLAHPKVSPQDKRRILGLALEGRAIQSVVVFADLLLRKKRLVLAADIAREFKALVDEAKGVQMATVVSAVALNDAERTRLLAELQTQTGKTIVLAEEVDPSLIGGAFVRIGDRVIDRSVKTLLEAVSHQLYEVSV